MSDQHVDLPEAAMEAAAAVLWGIDPQGRPPNKPTQEEAVEVLQAAAPFILAQERERLIDKFADAMMGNGPVVAALDKFCFDGHGYNRALANRMREAFAVAIRDAATTLDQDPDSNTPSTGGEVMNAGRFRKKPVEVEAVQWTGANRGEVAALLGLHPNDLRIEAGTILCGNVAAALHDYLLFFADGSKRSVRPKEFEATYEPVSVPQPNEQRYREALEEAGHAIRKTAKALMAIQGALEKPYEDDPRWSPWTRFVDRNEKSPRTLLCKADAAIRAALKEEMPDAS